MSHSGKLPLTVCMIVRNEAENLPAALASVRQIATEIVIVDTGSHDSTKEIASAAGCKVFEFDWLNDFAAARNFSLSKATQPWVLSLDADQRFPDSSVSALEQIITQKIDAAVVHIEAFDLTGKSVFKYPAVRLFKNDPRIRYAGRVHESVSDALVRHHLIQQNESTVILHDIGYGSAEIRQQKLARNLELLRQNYLDGSADLYLTYKYLQALSDSPERRSALEQTIGRLLASPDTRLELYPFIDELVDWCASDLLQQGKLKEAQSFSTAMAQLVKGHCCYTAGVVAAKSGDFNEVVTWFESYENIVDQIHPFRKQPRGCSIAMMGFWRAWCCRLQGDFHRAFELLGQFEPVANSAESELFACEKIRIHLSAGNLQVAATELATMMQRLPTAKHLNEFYVVAAEISSQLQQYEQTQYFLDQVSENDERKWLLQSILAFYQSNYAQSQEYLRKVVGTDCLNISLKEQLLEAMAHDQ